MRMTMLPVARWGMALFVLCAMARPASASWGAWFETWRPIPLVQEIEAERCRDVSQQSIHNDLQGDGGTGSEAVLMTPGGPSLAFDIDLRPERIYALFVIARAADGDASIPRKPAFARLNMREHATGQERSWTMRVTHREIYFAVAQMYFPAYAGGNYTLSFHLEPGSEQALLVDRMEVRDALGNCEPRPIKTRRMLTSDAALAALRKKAAAGFAKHKDTLLGIGNESFPPTLKPRSAEERRARDEEIWGAVPDFNTHFSVGPKSRYGLTARSDRGDIVADAARAYEATGNAEFGWDGAVALCALAEKFPASNYLVQGEGPGSNLDRDKEKQLPFDLGGPHGRNAYRGWSGVDLVRLVESYDRLYDFIKDNPDLAEFVGARIPWVRSPQDVIRLLDTHLLQSGIDNAARGCVENPAVLQAMVPLVLGVTPLSNRLLDGGLFARMGAPIGYTGSISDQIINNYTRDGVPPSGSAYLLSSDLRRIAELLHQYRQAGGAPRYDVRDASANPHLMESARTIEMLRVAGGLPLGIGDGPAQRRARETGVPPHPSRILAGFGAAILEVNPEAKDILSMRAAAVRTGMGRGSAHQDALNLEVFGHGCRLAPDIIGKPDARYLSSFSLRASRAHNLVEVDGRNFENSAAGSSVGATGWTVSFAPLPGAQFMANAARATSHPEVSLYQRDTVMIDAGVRDSYLFDVFRVRGGRVHTWGFHGAHAPEFRINAELTEATSAAAAEHLARHAEGTRREGLSPALLQADWPVDEESQKAHQGKAFEPGRRPALRVSLLGHEGRSLFVGNGPSEIANRDIPFLYVQAASENEGAETVWPAIIEPYAGAPFLIGQRLLSIAPDTQGGAPVAAEVRTADGRTDMLYSCLFPTPASVEGGLRVAGRFALVSQDAEGFRAAQLVGGTELSCGAVRIQAERAAWVGRIMTVDYPGRSFTVNRRLPEGLLRDTWAAIDNGRTVHNFKLSAMEPMAAGTRIFHEKTARFYRSPVASIDSRERFIECEIEPSLFGCDPNIVSGVTLANEAGDKAWRVEMDLGDRWMNLGWPGYRGSSPTRLTWKHFPDADKDGRRTLKLYGRRGDRSPDKRLLEGKVILVMEVLRIASDGETFYFKLPEEEKFRRGGWEYAGRRLENEDGSASWTAVYPGTRLRWRLSGDAPVRRESFTDIDGDGKASVSAYLFGPGDNLRLDTFVQVSRTARNLYELRANVPCIITLPGVGPVAVSYDGAKSFLPIDATPVDDTLTLKFDARNLGAGTLHLRVGTGQ